jgi:trehalose 6-phosphate synthase/phosphatase
MLPLEEAYDAPAAESTEGQVAEAISHINSEYGSLEYQPVQVNWQSLNIEDYVALLTISHCLLITPERDSINTAILDYVICQEEAFDIIFDGYKSLASRWGAPILSEFLGLSSFMPASFQVNPFDYEVRYIEPI